jgi:hypothetical protein
MYDCGIKLDCDVGGDAPVKVVIGLACFGLIDQVRTSQTIVEVDQSHSHPSSSRAQYYPSRLSVHANGFVI